MKVDVQLVNTTTSTNKVRKNYGLEQYRLTGNATSHLPLHMSSVLLNWDLKDGHKTLRDYMLVSKISEGPC